MMGLHQRVIARQLRFILPQQGDFNAIHDRLFRRCGFAKTLRLHPANEGTTRGICPVLFFNYLPKTYQPNYENPPWKCPRLRHEEGGMHPIAEWRAGAYGCGRKSGLSSRLIFAMHAPDSAVGLPPPERSIFAVDDVNGDLLLLARLLAQPGLSYPCRLFSSGEKVMDALLDVLRGAPAPLLCFIDVTMAGMSGFDVLRWIRCQDAFDSVPVIMLSSSDNPQHMREACGVGAQCYVRKFPSSAELCNLIAEAKGYTADRAAPPAFRQSCNLLLNLENAAQRSVLV